MTDLDPGLIDALLEPAAYPDVPSADDPSARAGIEHVQTHLSHVFLTGNRVYKLHKAAHFGFVDFRSRSERNADALREVGLNRRLAPCVYLGVAAVTVTSGGARIGPVRQQLGPRSDDVEYCVVMRRLPEGRDTLSLLEQGTLDRERLAAAASRIARFHADQRLGIPAPFSADEWRARMVEPALACFDELRGTGLEGPASALRLQMSERADALAERFERRRLEGRGVDGHGDLHLQHVFFEDAGPIVIDCITFRDDLRRIDAACDVAFLAMDLAYRQRHDLASHFLQSYAADADDHDLYAVVDFFVAYRAAVRAKVAQLAADDPELESGQRQGAARSARDHLDAVRTALTPRAPASCIVLSGLVGTGKSTVARALAELVDGVVIASDRIRKAQAGLAPTDRTEASWREGLYSQDRSAAVYASLLERAKTVVASGRIAILDATYARRADRERLRDALEPLGVRPLLVEATCRREVALARLARRLASGTDPSDAGPGLYEPSAARFEALDEWPPEERLQIHTDRPDWAADLRALAPRIRPDSQT
jgi:aminoglycoside phosphotransferase family enzyme/predicted kinase